MFLQFYLFRLLCQFDIRDYVMLHNLEMLRANQKGSNECVQVQPDHGHSKSLFQRQTLI